jgi:hypothetical protein
MLMNVQKCSVLFPCVVYSCLKTTRFGGYWGRYVKFALRHTLTVVREEATVEGLFLFMAFCGPREQDLKYLSRMPCGNSPCQH